MTSTVTLVHYGETPPSDQPIICLLGPSDFRSQPNWHQTVFEYFTRSRRRYALCLPTPRDNVWRGVDAAAQTRWQFDCQTKAKLGFFWIPYLAPMTFIEFGSWSEKSVHGREAVLGLPNDIPQTSGLLDYARECGVPRSRSLIGALGMADNILIHST